MLYFVEQPANRQVGDLLETTEPWYCTWVYKGIERSLYVPAGYVTDGASIPRVGWSVIGITPQGRIDAAALAHDALYRAAGGTLYDKMGGCVLRASNGVTSPVSRREADWVFRMFGVRGGIRRHRMRLAYIIVRACGRRYWGGPAPAFDS